MYFKVRFLPSLRSIVLSSLTTFALVFGTPHPLEAVPPNPPAVGTPQNFSGLTLIAPVDLAQVSDGPNNVDSESLHQGEHNGMRINVAMANYSGDPALTLKKSIDDYVKTIADMSGVTEVDRSQREVNLEGAIAQRLSLNITRADKILRAQILFVVRDQRVWTVQTIYPAATVEGDLIASTIIDSVRVKPATQSSAVKLLDSDGKREVVSQR